MEESGVKILAPDGTVYFSPQSLGLLHDVYRHAHHYVGCGMCLYDRRCFANGARMRIALIEPEILNHVPSDRYSEQRRPLNAALIYAFIR